MRWQALFGDLEGQWEAAAAAELAAEVSDRTRREQAQLRLVDRLRPALGAVVAVTVEGPATVHGVLTSVGSDWLLLTEQTGREALVPVGAVLTVGGLVARSEPPHGEGAVVARMDLRYTLRGIARGRATVAVMLRGGTTVTGTIDRVGADFVELSEHPAGEPRRTRAVRAVRTMPLDALVVVRSG